MIKSIEGWSGFIQTRNMGVAGSGKPDASETQGMPSFEQTLKSFIKETNTMQEDAGIAARELITGQTNDIHQVMILSEKASLSLDLLIEVRNKLVEGYQEIMRIQV